MTGRIWNVVLQDVALVRRRGHKIGLHQVFEKFDVPKSKRAHQWVLRRGLADVDEREVVKMLRFERLNRG